MTVPNDDDLQLAEWMNGVARKHGLGGPSPAETSDPETRADIQAEAEAFSRFPADIDTFQPQETSLTPEERRELDAHMAAMIERAEALRERLFAGRTTDDLSADELDQLLEVFAHIPRGLVPPRYKKELSDWRKARDAMLAMRVEEMMEEAEGETLETVSGVLEVVNSTTELAEDIPSETLERINDVVKKVSGALTVIASTVEAVEKLDEATEPEERTALEQRMADTQAKKAIQELGDTALEFGADFVPILGTINNAKNVLVNGSETLVRVNRAISDGKLRDRASLEMASQLGRALGQSCAREKRLGAQAGVDTVTASLDVAGDLSAAGDAGTLKIVNGVLKLGSAVVFNVADAMTDSAAWSTLNDARAGSEQAQQEVFRRHAHYAKYLIARYASEGHRVARDYFVNRGLTENDIEANSIHILMDFGLQESQEEEAPQTVSQKLKKKLEKVTVVASKIGRVVSAGVASARALIFGRRDDEPAEVITPAQGGKWFTVDVLEKMTRTLREAKAERDRLDSASVPNWLTQNIQNLEAGLREASVPLREYMGVLEGALSDAADEEDQETITAVRAQMEPLREALRYLSQAGFLR